MKHPEYIFNCATYVPRDYDFLRPGERVACKEATVIVDETGAVTGWIDNRNRLMRAGNVERQE